MKKLLVLLFSLCAAALIIGCGSAAPAPSPEAAPELEAAPEPEAAPAPSYDKAELVLSEYSDTAKSGDVLLHFDGEGAITGQGEIPLRYENNSDRDYTYTALQRLEVQLDGAWYMVPDAQNFVTMQIFTAPANSSVEQSFRFEDRYEPLLPGTFRILKSFTDYNGNQTVAWLEFTIE